jgi:hypothetical protein
VLEEEAEPLVADLELDVALRAALPGEPVVGAEDALPGAEALRLVAGDASAMLSSTNSRNRAGATYVPYVDSAAMPSWVAIPLRPAIGSSLLLRLGARFHSPCC